jgi:5-methylcytosine-specific restriction enzyme B
LTAVLRDDVIPLLEEYCYDDFEQVSEIIGAKLVDKPAQRIRRELFEADRGIDLIAALNHPEIVPGIRSVVTIDDTGDEDADEPDDVGPSNV